MPKSCMYIFFCWFVCFILLFFFVVVVVVFCGLFHSCHYFLVAHSCIFLIKLLQAMLLTMYKDR